MTVLVFELFGRDSSAGRVLDNVGDKSDRAGRRLNQLGRDADGAARSFNPLEVALSGVHRALVQNVTALAKTTAMVGGLGATALTVAPYLLSAAQQVWAVTESALAAAPALIGMAASAGVAAATIKLGFSDFGTALQQGDTPAQIKKIDKALASLHPEARKTAEAVRSMHPEFERIKRTVQGAIFEGLADNVNAVGNALLDRMAPGMARVGEVTNGVIDKMLSWAGSTAGLRLTEELTNSAYIGMSRLAPSIDRSFSAFGRMLDRITQVSTAAGASGLGGILDWLAGRMDRVTAASVSGALADLHNTYDTVTAAVTRTWEAVQTATKFYQEHRAEISLVSDALSVVAIAFGGPVVAVGAAVGMIIRHWDDLKAAYTGLTQFFATDVGVNQAMEFMGAGVAVVVPSIVGAFNTIKEAVLPVLTEIWNKIRNELLPAWGAFYNAISPVIAVIADILGPIVAATFQGILTVISGVITVITGILNVFAGLLTGDWSRLWDGIKQIFSGAWDVIVGLLQTFIFGKIPGVLGKLLGVVASPFRTAGRAAIDAIVDMGIWVERTISKLIERIPGALGSTVRLLYEAGRGIVLGLIDGIKSMITSAGRAMGQIVQKIKDYLPWSPAKEGPLSGAGSPHLAGRKIPAMVAGGILGGVGQVADAASVMARRAGLASGGLPALPALSPFALGGAGGALGGLGRITIDSSGSRLDDLLLEVLKRSIRTKGGGDLRKYLAAA